eukprot:4278338-Pyramimonas_sp.AAC.1
MARSAVFAQAKIMFTSTFADLAEHIHEMQGITEAWRRSARPPILSWEVHAIRGDAANSTEWRSHKIFCSELWSAFCVPDVRRDADGAITGVAAKLSSSLMWPDLCW